MNILLYEWNTFGQRDLEESLIRLGHKVDKIKYVFYDFEKDEAFEKRLTELFLLKKYDFVISFNYFQVISNMCNTFCIKYIAWVWDSPLINLNSRTIYNPVNYIFIFDGALYQQMKYELKADTVYYLPLAVNTERLERLTFLPGEEKQYEAEVSFVGNLYDKRRNYYDEISNLPDYLAGYFDGIMKAQMRIYGYNFMKEMLTEDILEELEKYIDIRPGSNFIGDVRDIFADRFLNAKITSMERRQLLQSLSKYYDVTLYSGSDSSEMVKVRNKGYIDYYTVMPKVFRHSKINLNMTVRTIKTGIPLRVFDILGAEGFLITNYQSDIADYFTIGEDLVCYDSEEDLIAKVGYYLDHEEERKRIAENGYRKVKQFHNYEIRLREMLRIASEDIGLEKQSEDLPELEESIQEVKQKLSLLVREGRIEDAKALYYSCRRSNPELVTEPSFTELDLIFQIYSYEKLRQQESIFDSGELDKVWGHYVNLKGLITGLEQDNSEMEQALVRYTESMHVSYTAIESIINRFTTNKVGVLNRIAWAFLQAGKMEMVIPFLSQAIELAPKDDITLYHLAYALHEFGEYQMAYDYINEIAIAPPGAIELMEDILKHI